jgi:hypothetical protein
VLEREGGAEMVGAGEERGKDREERGTGTWREKKKERKERKK